MAGCAGDKLLHSSMCTLLLAPISSSAPVFFPLLYLLSPSPGPLVLIQNKPAVSCQIRDRWVCVSQTLTGEASLTYLSRGFPPPSWSQHHLSRLCVILFRVLGRKLNVILIAFLSHQHLLTSGFLSSTLSSIHYPFAADGCHLSLLLSPHALFFFCAFLLVFDSFIFTLMRFREAVQWKACV